MVIIFVSFNFINFGFQLRYMYRKNGLFLRGHVLEPNYDYIETKSSSSILFKASPTKDPREKEFLRYPKGSTVNIYEVVL